MKWPLIVAGVGAGVLVLLGLRKAAQASPTGGDGRSAADRADRALDIFCRMNVWSDRCVNHPLRQLAEAVQEASKPPSPSIPVATSTDPVDRVVRTAEAALSRNLYEDAPDRVARLRASGIPLTIPGSPYAEQEQGGDRQAAALAIQQSSPWTVEQLARDWLALALAWRWSGRPDVRIYGWSRIKMTPTTLPVSHFADQLKSSGVPAALAGGAATPGVRCDPQRGPESDRCVWTGAGYERRSGLPTAARPSPVDVVAGGWQPPAWRSLVQPHEAPKEVGIVVDLSQFSVGG